MTPAGHGHRKTTFGKMPNRLLLLVLAGAAIALAGSWRAGSVALLSLGDPTGPLSDEEVVF